MATPVGFVLSLLGVILNRDRLPGVLGLIISGALLALFLATTLG